MRRILVVVVAVLLALAYTSWSMAQGPAPTAAPEVRSFGLWPLFVQSFDLFTVLLILGSISALAVVFSCLIDIRVSKILPPRAVDRIINLSTVNDWEGLRDHVSRDESFAGRVIRAAMAAARSGDRDAVRESAELAAAEESARWFRRIEVLNVIGNLGPLIGLAGTVWGMILAFTSLGAAGGQAGPADLSLGISKALFHTLLGLCLAIPCLLIFGLYRSVIDRICTRGMVICGQVVERLPTGPTSRQNAAPAGTGR